MIALTKTNTSVGAEQIDRPEPSFRFRDQRLNVSFARDVAADAETAERRGRFLRRLC